MLEFYHSEKAGRGGRHGPDTVGPRCWGRPRRGAGPALSLSGFRKRVGFSGSDVRKGVSMQEPVNLDDVMTLGEMDPGGMLAAVEDFPRQCAEALSLGREAPELPDTEGISRVAFVGMGGSAIGGDILRALLEDVVGMPMSVHRSYRLPSLLGPDTLAVFVSYSGNTEETLSALDDAIYLGCRVLVLTTGGKLLERARANRYPAVVIPGGLQPRAALGYLSLTAAAAMERMGLIQGFVRVAHGMAESLRAKGEEWGRLSPLEKNFAKQLAEIEKGRKEPVLHVGNLDSVRDFTDVRDTVNAYYLILENGVPGEVYNVATGKGYTIRQVLDILLGFVKVKVEIRPDPARMRPSDVELLIGDSTRLHQATGWEPKFRFEQTLKDLLDYWRARV
uniref:NAD-dependent epimerase/dehydratase family protein n=1 Tax=candidate division WOR-3 bacterium TaxID=2052148 RepID=A0A7C4GE68_UNCW3